MPDHNRQNVISELNELFQEERIVWKIGYSGDISLKTDEANEAVIHHAISGLEESSRATAAQELKKTVKVLSQRPIPDTRDAVRGALGAMRWIV